MTTRHAATLVLLALASLALHGCANVQTVSASPQTTLADPAHIHPGDMHVIAEARGFCPVCNVYELRRASVVRIRTETGLGTGVVLDDTGSVLTNAHVVGDSETVTIETNKGTTARASVIRRDKAIDLALLSTAATDVKWAGIQPSPAALPVVGSTVYVIGHPAGLGWTLTQGIVSGQRASGEVQANQLIQITAAVSPGNSGGPAFDERGVWIGTVSSKLVGPGLENISFVIPASELTKFLAAKIPAAK